MLTEVDVGIGGVGAANPGVAGHGAALVEGHELVQVVEIGEHLHHNNRPIRPTAASLAIKLCPRDTSDPRKMQLQSQSSLAACGSRRQLDASPMC